MRFETWEPLYLEILDDFGFSRERDEEAGRLLFDLLKSGQNFATILAMASKLVRCQFVVVCGNAPTLADEMNCFLGSRYQQNCVFIASDGATSVLLKAGVVPEIIVSDLDGCMDDILRANDHDLRTLDPRFGGFTDGDRSVFFARYLGVSAIKLIGFDFDDMSVTPRKHKKLAWAKRLIELALR